MYFLWDSDQVSWSPIRHGGLRPGMSVSLGLQSDLLMFIQACRLLNRHVSLRWASNQACRYPIRYVILRFGMLVFDQACQSPMDMLNMLNGYDSLQTLPLINCLMLKFADTPFN